ncbi:MAG: hypothetical protein ACYS9Y_12945 [Planctomycetota bacterium]
MAPVCSQLIVVEPADDIDLVLPYVTLLITRSLSLEFSPPIPTIRIRLIPLPTVCDHLSVVLYVRAAT